MNKELIFNTEDGEVIVRQTDRGIELHIPRNWRGWRVSQFLAEHDKEIAPLRKAQQMPENLIKDCIKVLHDHSKDGYTYNPWTKLTPQPKFSNKRKGYAVALTNNVLPGTVMSNQRYVTDLLIMHSLKLKLDDMYVGVWQYEEEDDEGKMRKWTCVDLVKVINDREDAVETGRLRRQKAIHDLDKGIDVYLKDEPFVIEI